MMRDFDLPLNDLVSVLRSRAQLHPERTAIDFLGDGDHITESLSYAELDRRVRALAAHLQSEAQPGERVLLLFPSGPDYVTAFFACLYAGLIAVPAYPPEVGQPHAVKRLLSILGDAEPALALTDTAGMAALVQQGVARASTRVLITSLTSSQPGDWRTHIAAPGDIAFLQYTSGSTAAPKGVIVTHAHLVADKHGLSHAFTEREGDRYMSWLPLFHDMGLILGLLQPLFYGLTLVLMSPKHFLERPRRWLEAISRHRATISCGPDFAYRLCADRIRPPTIAGLDLSCWRVAASGSEPVRHTTLQAFAELACPLGFDVRAFNPCYGLAEATLFASGHPKGGLIATRFDVHALAQGIARAAEAGTTLVACGSSHPDTLLRIVDPRTLMPLPDGNVGEIWLRGPTVAGGYWRNSSATQDSFSALDAKGNGPFLRTGDLGFLHEGQVYLSSRLKDLIILRGRNFYPQDIELEIEARVHGVRPGRVSAFAIEHEGVEAIGIAAEAARLRPGEGSHADVVERIRDLVARSFNEPVAVVALLAPGALPKTSSGKLQRSAARQAWEEGSLPTVATYRAERTAQDYLAPAGHVQERLAFIWAELLDVDRVGAQDNFFALGGQSLLMTQLAARVQSEFGVQLSLGACFASKNLAGMADLIERAPKVESRQEPAPVPRDGSPLPLTHAQQRLWFLQSLEPDSSFYHVAIGLKFDGDVNPDRLQQALNQLVRRHESLRTVFLETEEGPRQCILATQEMALERCCLTHLQAVGTSARAFLARRFDLARGPVWRGLFIEVPGEAPQLVIAMHHIAVDGASLRALLHDLAHAYAGGTLAPLPLQYADYAAWQHTHLLPRLSALAKAWSAKLKDAPALTTLPPDHPRPAVQSHRGHSLHAQLPPALVAASEQWARRHQATLFMALFAAYAATLAEACGQRDLVIGTDVANRPATAGRDEMVGFFVNQLAVRCVLDNPGSGEQTLHSVRDTLISAYAHQDLPFDKLVEALRPARELSHAPVFQTKFVYQDRAAAYTLAPGIVMAPFDIDRETAELDLLFDLVRRGSGLSLRVEYAVDLYRAETIERFVSRFMARLEGWLSGSSQSVPPPRRSISRRAARGHSLEATP